MICCRAGDEIGGGIWRRGGSDGDLQLAYFLLSSINFNVPASIQVCLSLGEIFFYKL